MLPNVLTNALIPMRYHVTLNTLLGISRVTLHITTILSQPRKRSYAVMMCFAAIDEPTDGRATLVLPSFDIPEWERS